jgi:hypothetical protein
MISFLPRTPVVPLSYAETASVWHKTEQQSVDRKHGMGAAKCEVIAHAGLSEGTSQANRSEDIGEASVDRRHSGVTRINAST